ncbi:hypothetical protein [Rhizorhapis suberifaciens]|uniref:Putative HicB family RNase H-like nuclease n=1 Tax=Rhizorhapis suberifaciens TaxID=13656 RepID=A0A840HQS9_9SPHN|nr:hypothetical protein [Rhizorhapis suberifaciens]MBB4639987.1 putative HicB family RNase H-like nuclease [Rhizorhapis suberifaciens]
MGEPKPFASLTSGLLARKGAAKPAMRRQYMGGMGGMTLGHEDLGWNDMGEDSDTAPVVNQPHAGLSPLPSHTPVAEPEPPVALVDELVVAPVEVPAIVEQRQMLVEKVGQFEEEASATKAGTAKARSKSTGPGQRQAKAAFTLRLDPDRHLKLRLACAVTNRSAQQLVIQALDELLQQSPHVEQLAGQLKPRRAARA